MLNCAGQLLEEKSASFYWKLLTLPNVIVKFTAFQSLQYHDCKDFLILSPVFIRNIPVHMHFLNLNYIRMILELWNNLGIIEDDSSLMDF